jgi:macrodomain Ter protein organizer (MatP/YcbG family)
MERKSSTIKSGEQPVRSSSVDLEFPDWSAMKDRSKRLTREAAFRLTELYPALLSEAERTARQDSGKCLVEFVL